MNITHPEMVRALSKTGEAILAQMTADKAELAHIAMAIPGEAGEISDALKKFVIYGHDLDRHNVIEEIGDMEFFLERLRQITGISREETLAANMAKLALRYKSYRYTDERAKQRADKLPLNGQEGQNAP
jgi:NTP pyrophosphatase (non-canonical NTP hydrolase)